jgi:hypothetical protein
MPGRHAISPSERRTEVQVVTKAVVKAASLLDMSNTALGRVVGVSDATVSRMRAGEWTLGADTKPYELSVLFLRLFRGLDAIVGGDAASAKSWLRSPNAALHDVPFTLIQTVSGLMQAVQYVDARRARI